MPRVLVLCEYSSLNGGERSLLAVVKGVRSAGFDLLVATHPQGPLADELSNRNIAVWPLETTSADGTRQSQAVLRKHLRHAIIDTAPDLVHANSLSMSRLAGPVVAELGLPSVGHLRDMIKISAAAMADLNCHTRLLAVSQATRDWYVAAGMAGAKTHVLYNGVDLDRFRPRAATGYLHEQLGLTRDVPLVASIGQVGVRKGLDVFLEAARLVVKQGAAAHFVIVGQRHSQKDEARKYEQDLRAAAATGSLSGRVHFLGRRNDIHRLLNEVTILVHAARQEPLGRVLLEAAASGTTIVASRVGGTAEIFPPGSAAAMLVAPEKPVELAGAILAALENPTLRGSLSSAARRRAEIAFDARVAALDLAKHYEHALNAEPASD